MAALEPGTGTPKTGTADSSGAPSPLSVSQSGGLARVVMPFDRDADKLDDRLQASLRREVMPLLQNNPGWNIQIQSFATSASDEAGSDKRLSLARALAVRSWMMEQGIAADRLDIRARGEGEKSDQPADRVELVLFSGQQRVAAQ
jgi:outer membrane protein OmpA-like peptidoglycan-associated protein